MENYLNVYLISERARGGFILKFEIKIKEKNK